MGLDFENKPDTFSISFHGLMLPQAGELVFFPIIFSTEAWASKCKQDILGALHALPQEPSQKADKVLSWELAGTRTSVFPFTYFSFRRDTAQWFSPLRPTTL